MYPVCSLCGCSSRNRALPSWQDEEDHSKGDVKDGFPIRAATSSRRVFQIYRRYPNLKCIARHVRYAHSGSENSLKPFMWYQGRTFESQIFTFQILDRVVAATLLPVV